LSKFVDAQQASARAFFLVRQGKVVGAGLVVLLVAVDLAAVNLPGGGVGEVAGDFFTGSVLPVPNSTLSSLPKALGCARVMTRLALPRISSMTLLQR